jgi:hypothetical protein
MRDRLEPADLAPELLALVRVRDGQLERLRADADGLERDSRPSPSVSSTVATTSPAAIAPRMSGSSTRSTASRCGTKPSIWIDQTSSPGCAATSLSTNGPA